MLDTFEEWIALIAIVISIVNMIITFYKMRVKGPDFIVQVVRYRTPWSPSDDGLSCSVKFLLQNIGDRFGYIIMNLIVQFEDTQGTVYTSEERTKKHFSLGPYSQEKSKELTFTMDEDSFPQNTTNHQLIIRAKYTTHKGEYLDYNRAFDFIQ